jgi:predicted acyl esterase
MNRINKTRALTLLAVLLGGFVCGTALCAQGVPQSKATELTSETPARLEPVTTGFDYVRREVMIPMRDGVKLHTVILVPKGAKNAGILLTRTPYDANAQTEHGSAHLGPMLSGYDNRCTGR